MEASRKTGGPTRGRDRFLKEKAVYHPASIGSQLPRDVEGKNVLIVDFSYPKDIILELIKKAKNVLILDHHKSVPPLGWAASFSAGFPKKRSPKLMINIKSLTCHIVEHF